PVQGPSIFLTIAKAHEKAGNFGEVWYYYEQVKKAGRGEIRSEEHTSELQSRRDLVCRLLLEKKKADRTGERCARPRRRPVRGPIRERALGDRPARPRCDRTRLRAPLRRGAPLALGARRYPLP